MGFKMLRYCSKNIWVEGLLDDEALSSAAELIKSRLKKLKKLVINRVKIRLGTDWAE
jgi:hypothetical protein